MPRVPVNATNVPAAPRGSGRLRFLDRYVGIPLLWLAGHLRRRLPVPASPASIGVLKAYAIGDTVLLAGVTADLRAAYPGAEIVFFAGRDNAAVARMLGDVDEVVEFDISRPWAAIAELRRRRLDVLFDFGAWPRIEALVAALSGARHTVGFRTAGQHRHYCFDAAVEHSAARHEIDNYRAIAGALGIPTGATPHIEAPAPPAQAPPAPYAVLHLWPGGFRSHLKEWPQERWRALAGELAERGLGVALTGGPADAAASQAFAEACRSDGHDVVDTAGAIPLTGVAGLLAGSACVVSVNTGIMHLAAAAGAPTVGLSGPTSGRRWGPVGERVVSLDSDYDGCGYLNLGSEYAGRRADCMEGISLERVLAAVDAVPREVTARG
jgi:ADP-heptose:LPS heptosyltransferase